MTRLPVRSISVVAALIAAGCLPEKRIVWSPDGSRAAVIAHDGLHFCTPDGALTRPLLPAARRVAWFPDGRRLLVVHTTKAGAWSDVEKIVTPAQREAIIAAGKEFRAQALAYDGPWDKFKAAYSRPFTGGEQAAALLYVRDRDAAGLAEHVGDPWKEIGKLAIDIWNAQVFDAAPEAVVPGRVLAVSIDEIVNPAVAPTGRLASYLRPRPGKDQLSDIVVVPVDGGTPLVAATSVARNYDWSPDGRSLAYIYTSNPEPADSAAIQLGAVATIDVADDAGALLPAPAKQDDRAGLLFQQFLTVRWLADGRLLFSSYETTLPATSRDMPQQWTLFAIDPRMSASVLRVLPRDFAPALKKELPWFDVSPDGRRVLLPGPSGQVATFDLVTAESQEIVATNDPDGDLRTLPVWRNNEEACVAVPPGSPLAEVAAGKPATRAEIVLWRSPSVHRCISRAWPVEAVDEWLIPKPRGPAPATSTRPAP